MTKIPTVPAVETCDAAHAKPGEVFEPRACQRTYAPSVTRAPEALSLFYQADFDWAYDGTQSRRALTEMEQMLVQMEVDYAGAQERLA